MAERTVELDSTQDNGLQAAEERVRRAEEELRRLRAEHAQAAPKDAATVGARISSGKDEPPAEAGEQELRRDPMMSRLMDALHDGQDIGHYGRLVFAMVARHFLPHEEVLTYLQKDRDFSEEQARAMLQQVDTRDYNPPRRERLLEWQREQEFQFIREEDPDDGNLYRNLRFPQEIYDHIGGYQEAKAEAA